MAQPTLVFFPTRTLAGGELEAMTIGIAQELGFTVKQPPEPRSPQGYQQAIDNEDVVVLDGTVEHPGLHNYDIAFPMPFDHVLVVSRTPLPLNFYGMRDSIDHGHEVLTGAPLQLDRRTNQQLLLWLRLQLEDLLPSLPRPKEQRGLVGATFRASATSLAVMDRRRNRTGEIFISFRNYLPEQSQGYPRLFDALKQRIAPGHNESIPERIEKLKQRIQQGHFPGEPARIVRYFPPKTLSNEFMSAQRRWSVLADLDRFIAPASEMWVYETPHYYNSWWTLGELLTIAYRAQSSGSGHRPLPRLRIYNPDNDSVRDAPPSFLPRLTEAQRKRMARWYGNADRHEMAPESVLPMAFYRMIPFFGKAKNLNDPVFSQQFWLHPILDCAKCRVIGEHGHQFDVDAVLWMRSKGFTPVDVDAIRTSKPEVSCPSCGTSYGIVQGEPAYLWVRPMSRGALNGMLHQWYGDYSQGDDALIKLPYYSLGNAESHANQGLPDAPPSE